MTVRFLVTFLILFTIAKAETPEAFALAAKKLHDKGDLQGALLGYDKAIAMAQKRPAYYFQRAKVKRDMGRPHYAIVDLDIAVSFDPKFADGWHQLGIVNYVVGNYGDALRNQYMAIMLNKENADFWLWAGMAARKTGNDADAITYLRCATRLDDTLAMIWYHFGLALAAERQPILAADKLTKAIELDDKDPAFLQARSFCYLQKAVKSTNKKSFLASAKNDLAAVWKAYPELPDVQSLRATLAYLTDGPKAAINQLRKDLEHLSDSDKIPVKMRLWALYVLTGDVDKGRAILDLPLEHLNIERRELLACLRDGADTERLNSRLEDIDLLSERWIYIGILRRSTNLRDSVLNLELSSVRPLSFEGIVATAILDTDKSTQK